MKIFKLLSATLLVAMLVLLPSCGKNGNQIVKDVNLETSVDENEDVFVEVSAFFDLGGMSLTSITLPIIDPRAPETVYGEISFLPTLTGYNEIAVKVNLTKCAQISGGAPTMPNGEQLPIAGLPDSTIELEIDQIHSKIYLALDHDVVAFGFAIGIKEFDVLQQYLPGSNVFLGFDYGGVRGTAGLFTGQQTYESGLGFFIDLSSVVNIDMLNDILDTPAEEKGMIGGDVAPATFVTKKIKSRRKRRRLDKGIYKMHKKYKKLHLIEK